MTHTPGPWKVGPIDDTVVTASDGSEIAAIDGDYSDPDLWPIMEANARLITTAPDGLALAHMVIDTATVETPPALIEAANALIAKAKGQP